MRKAIACLAAVTALVSSGVLHAQTASQPPYPARAFNPAHSDLPRSAGRSAQLANEAYVEQLAHIVYYWAYPAIDLSGRTSMWEMMKAGPGLMFGIGPAPR